MQGCIKTCSILIINLMTRRKQEKSILHYTVQYYEFINFYLLPQTPTVGSIESPNIIFSPTVKLKYV